MTTQILVDTNVMSLALRRRPEKISERERQQVDHLLDLLAVRRAAIIGAVRQELLTGIRSEDQFAKVQRRVDAFPLIEVSKSTHDLAAVFANRCIDRGIAIGPVDLLFCAAASERRLPVWSVDPDFIRCASVVGELELYDDNDADR